MDTSTYTTTIVPYIVADRQIKRPVDEAPHVSFDYDRLKPKCNGIRSDDLGTLIYKQIKPLNPNRNITYV